MTSIADPAMIEALRLTRTGSLAAATELLQRTLRMPAAAVAGAAPASSRASDAVIDLVPGRRTESARETQPAGQFLERSYHGPEGAIDYRLYVPAAARPGMPLVVMLHGCTQSPEDFARGTGMNRLADEFGLIVAYPGQPRSANAQKCWNWFRPGDQNRDGGEPARIAAVARAVVAEQDCDPSRVYAAGLSAGGAAAAILGAGYPDLFAAIGVHSGLACGSAHDVPSAFATMRSGATRRAAGAVFVPVITFHGDRDTTVSQRNAEQIVADAGQAAGVLASSTQTGVSDGGRRYTRTMARDAEGRITIEQWTIHGAGHAWSGGDGAGSYTDPQGPDASRAMIGFFLQHRLAAA